MNNDTTGKQSSDLNCACDIILPVHNALTQVADCIESLMAFTDRTLFRLHIVDDVSDARTAAYLRAAAREHAHVSYCRNSVNRGFVKSCNYGLARGRAPFAVILNSDTIVTPGWLEGLLACADSDPRIAAVNPLTNHASQLNVAMPPGANFLGVAEFLGRNAARCYPDVVTAVGFCLMLRRSVLKKVGYFDEIYGHGYCEESDLSMRLTTKGYRTVVADDVYVYHQGHASFRDRDERYSRNRAVFDRRWANEYKRQFAAFKKANPLQPVRDMLSPNREWHIKPYLRNAYRVLRSRFRAGDPRGLIREGARCFIGLPAARRDDVTRSAVAGVTRAGRLRVTYVLHHLTVAGGVLSVIQLVNELILLGVEARIVALRDYPEVYAWKILTRPVIYKNERELLQAFPDSDIAVATHWTTAGWVSKLVSAGRAAAGAYFLQDYEGWFYPDTRADLRTAVKKTYAMIPHRIVKSDWLSALLEADGFPTKKILLGMDLKLFYPRHVEKHHAPSILAMARPRTPRRGYNTLIAALQMIKKARPEIEVVLFGDYLDAGCIPFAYRDAGVITDQNRLAELYTQADVFIDASDFQGFGRTGLEAMACGSACVLTGVGGVAEYALHEQNCLVAPPRQPDAIAAAVFRLLKEPALRQKLCRGGMETVKRFCHKREARETLAYFTHAILRQKGTGRVGA